MPWILLDGPHGSEQFRCKSRKVTCGDRRSLTQLQNASWSINSLKVYKKQVINGQVSAADAQRVPIYCVSLLAIFAIAVALLA